MHRNTFFSLLTLTAVVIGLSLGLGFKNKTYSQEAPSAALQACGTQNACCTQYTKAIEAADRDWQVNLQGLVDQEKPASEMVDEAYQNLRTYNCWLEYICRAVQYSGYAPVESALGTGLTSTHLGQVPGCQKPQDLKMKKFYASFTEELKKEPLFGSSQINKEKLYQKDKVNFFPGCMTDSQNNNEKPDVTQLNNNFQGCKLAIESKFGCSSDLASEDFQACLEGKTGNPTSLVILDTTLKSAHAEQRAMALENKLGDIVARLQATQEQVSYLSNFLTQLDQRLACLALQCS